MAVQYFYQIVFCSERAGRATLGNALRGGRE
jgi:hypothetical protein